MPVAFLITGDLSMRLSQRVSVRAARCGLFLALLLAAIPAHGQVSYELLKAFDPQFPNGMAPDSPLFEASDGRFYGTIPYGGAFGRGTALAIDPSGESGA